MKEPVRNEIEALIGKYKHNVHLYETLIKTKLDIINSNDLYINQNASHGAILEFLECRVKIESFNLIISDLRNLLKPEN